MIPLDKGKKKATFTIFAACIKKISKKELLPSYFLERLELVIFFSAKKLQKEQL